MKPVGDEDYAGMITDVVFSISLGSLNKSFNESR